MVRYLITGVLVLAIVSINALALNEMGNQIRSIYTLLEMQGVNTYVIMDTQVRTFHYVKPHKGPVYFCPECMKLKKEILERAQIKHIEEMSKRFKNE